MVNIDIRILVPEDAEAYRKLRLEALLNSPEAFNSSYEEVQRNSVNAYKVRFQSENSYSFGAFEDDVLIGVVTLVRETKLKTDHITTIFAVYVTPYKRGRGVGKQLLQTAVNHAMSLNGVEQVKISVVAKKDTAKSLYYAMGFVPYGTHKRAVKLGDIYYDEEQMIMFL
ncbi:GNAT family N-acetyltransferase [Virgibacillus doumboii]|uniref:GNAT family N-acetyltransferase n=1 Tax=Virgibacillus doumboii TaxID=2697503 RepID=UPI001FE63633|nr:GNAT family N-acetyltransferase [Virgibacillus doumboii]